MNMEVHMTDAALAAVRKLGISREFIIPPTCGVPATGDLLEIEAANGQLALVVLRRAFGFSSGIPTAQVLRLYVGLQRDETRPLEAVRS